jgi:adenosylhomocysteine nucleosidase
MICYAFPLAHEAAGVLDRCRQKESFSIGGLHCTLGNFGNRPVLVALVGMGQERAEENTRKIFSFFRPKALVLAGYGGALVEPLKRGQVVVSNNFSSSQVLPFLRLLSGFDFAGFSTSDELADTPQKRDECARRTNGHVVDMETAAVAEVVHERQVPFVAVRAISDDYRQVLPVGALAAGFDPAKGRTTPLRLFWRLATHPREVAPFKKFVSGLGPARRNLTSFLWQLNEELPRRW